jgi:hypothetical protein
LAGLRQTQRRPALLLRILFQHSADDGGEPVDLLADEGQAIIAALDELFSRAWK